MSEKIIEFPKKAKDLERGSEKINGEKLLLVFNELQFGGPLLPEAINVRKVILRKKGIGKAIEMINKAEKEEVMLNLEYYAAAVEILREERMIPEKGVRFKKDAPEEGVEIDELALKKLKNELEEIMTKQSNFRWKEEISARKNTILGASNYTADYLIGEINRHSSEKVSENPVFFSAILEILEEKGII